jgi:hypothetical protein
MRLSVSVLVSGIIGVCAGLTAPPGSAQEPKSLRDADRDETVTATEAQRCAQQRFDLSGGSADRLAEEQSAAALPEADRLRQQFAQVDRDCDGRISRDEWMAWFGPAYAGAAKAAEAQLRGTD